MTSGRYVVGKGDAKVSVKNVAPHTDGDAKGVNFYLEIEWPELINVALDITVLGQPDGGQILS
ncbi:hypothetical protein [Bacillus sp. H1a]|uniref:hypothetical protein n=1 Tax=Bacillus sp. H1a TaxID=1397276 RepID=UPI000467F231|nr:hypothetical protein [Bacillus sp. H1a]